VTNDDQLKRIERKIDRLDSAIRGDGNGNPGLATRMDRLEQRAMKSSKLIGIGTVAIFAIVVDLVIQWIVV